MAVFGKGRYGLIVVWQGYKADTYWYRRIGQRDNKYSYFMRTGGHISLKKLEKPIRPRVDSSRTS